MFFFNYSYEITWIPSLKLTSPLKMDLLILKLVTSIPTIHFHVRNVSFRECIHRNISFDWWKLDVSPNPLGQLMSTMGRDVSEPWRGRGQKSEGFTMESFLNIMIANLGNWQLKNFCVYLHPPRIGEMITFDDFSNWVETNKWKNIVVVYMRYTLWR